MTSVAVSSDNSDSLAISTAPGLKSSPPIDEPRRRVAPAAAAPRPPARSSGINTGPSTAAVAAWLTIVVLIR